MELRILKFGPFVFDPNRNLLIRNGNPVLVSQRALSLLSALLQADGKPVSKFELMEAAWPNENVEESNLTVQIAALRKCLGRSPQGGEWIVTIQRLGYQFAVPNATTSIEMNREILNTLPKDALAVLPFEMAGTEEEYEYFADGLAEDLITDLSKVQGLVVIARHSSFKFRGSGFDLSKVSAELGVRYIVTGQARRSARRVRINVQLVDVEKNVPAWAERFDGDLLDVFNLQDRITHSVVAAIRGVLARTNIPERYHSTSLEAYDLVVKSRRLPDQSLAKNREAYENFSQAAILDPNYPEAHLQMAVTQLLWWCLWNGDMAEARKTALASAQRAITLAPNDALANEALGFVYMKLNRSDESKIYYERALEIDPNSSTTYSALCDLYINWGLGKEALDAIVMAIRLNPHPPGWLYDHLGRAQILSGDYEEAIITLKRIETYGTFSGCFLAAALALADHKVEAIEEAQAFQRLLPYWSISRWITNEFLRNEKVEQFWIDAFRSAGLPE